MARAAAIALLILQPVLFFFRVLILKQEHIPYDLPGFHLPLVAYVARMVREGTFPFWDPFQHCGMPIYADSQVQIFYPPVWIAILLGNLKHGITLLYWLEWATALHMAFAGVLLFFFLHRMGCSTPAALLGGTAFELGAFFASQTQHLGAMCVGAWLPLIVWATWELRTRFRLRWFSILTLAYAMAILAGFAAGTFVVVAAGWLFAIALLIVRTARPRLLLSVTGAGLLALAVCAVQLVPTWMLSRESVAADRFRWFLNGGGLPWESLVSFVSPNFYHLFSPFDPSLYHPHANFTFLYTYCGMLTMLLFFAAPLTKSTYARATFVLTLICAVWMLGENARVYTLFYTHVPFGVRGALYAEYALIAFTFFTAFTAAHTFDRLSFRLPRWLPWSLALVTSADLILVSSNRSMNAQPGSYEAQNSEYHVFDAGRVDDTLRRLTSATVPPERVDYLDDIFFAGILGSEMIRVPTPAGDNPFALKRFLDLRRLFAAGSPSDRRLPATALQSPLLDLLNVRFLIGQVELTPDALARAHLTFEAKRGGYRVYRRSTTLPRFFVVHRVRLARSGAEALDLLRSPSFNPAVEAVVETPITVSDNGTSEAPVHVDRFDPNRVELTVRARSPGLLVSSETMYRGWRATLNDRDVPLLTVNEAFRGIAVPAGVSRIRMDFRPAGYSALVWLSGVLALTVVAGALFGR